LDFYFDLAILNGVAAENQQFLYRRVIPQNFWNVTIPGIVTVLLASSRSEL